MGETVGGTITRFTAASGDTVDVTVDQDNLAVRDLLSMLPLALDFDDFAGKEKIAYPPRAIHAAGSPSSRAGAGDLAIYVPWGNLALFHAGERGKASTAIVRSGVFDATGEQLDALKHGDVTVAERSGPRAAHRPSETQERTTR